MDKRPTILGYTKRGRPIYLCQGGADDDTLTREAHEAIVAQAVRQATETAATEQAALQSQVTEATTRADVLEAEKAALVTERDAARQEFADFKAQLEQDREIAARREVRVAKIKEIAPALVPDAADEKFIETASRWASMEDDAFAFLVEQLSKVSTPAAPPRESAMVGETPKPPANGFKLREFATDKVG